MIVNTTTSSPEVRYSRDLQGYRSADATRAASIATLIAVLVATIAVLSLRHYYRST